MLFYFIFLFRFSSFFFFSYLWDNYRILLITVLFIRTDRLSCTNIRVIIIIIKWHGWWCEFLVWRTLRYDNCRRRKWSPRYFGKFITSKVKILTCVVLLGRSNMLRGIWAGVYDEEEISIALFCYCYQLLFQPCTPLLQSKPPPTFQAVSNNEGLRNIFPKKEQRKPSKVKNK